MANKIIRRRGYRREYDEFHQAVAGMYGHAPSDGGAAAIPDGLLRREFAWRPANAVSEVFVPMSLAMGYAVIGAGVGALIGDAYAGNLWRFSGIGALVLGAGAFATITRQQLRSLWTMEEYGDEETETSPIASPPRTVHVEITEQDERGRFRRMRFVDLPLTEQQYDRLTLHIINSREFSRDALTKASVCSQKTYPQLKAAMLAAGLIREIDRKGTVEITPAGRAMARE